MQIENLDLSELQNRISAAELSWRVREVPAGEAHGLGHEPAPAQEMAVAEQLGTSLLTQLHEQPVGLVLHNLVDWADILKHLQLRPADFDWRDHGAIGPVQDQGWCGSCVSFATTGLVGAQAQIELGIANLHLSEADQHFCSSHGATCGGWNNHDALDQIRTRGVATDATFPYMTAFDSPPQVTDPADPNSLWKAYCRPEFLRWLHTYSITNFTAHTGDDRKTYLSTVGPMVCGFTVYEDFDNYGGGVYKHVWGNVRGGHAVLVVGYSDTDGAWICRNSWGTGFGGPAHADGTGAGFFKIAYGDSNIDGEAFYGCRGVIAPHLIDLRIPDLTNIRIQRTVLPG
jgi:Papain family cysteine protease